MPEARELIAEGIRYERGGALDKALANYRKVPRVTTDAGLAAEALRRESDVLRTQCQWHEALDAARRSAQTAGAAGLADLHAEALNAEAAVHQTRGDFEMAATLYQSMLTVGQDKKIRGIALQNLGALAARRGDLDSAETYFRDSSNCFEQAGYARGKVIALNNYSAVALDRQDWDLAAHVGEQAVVAAKDLGDTELVAIAMLNKAEALGHQGSYSEAEELAGTALGHFGVTANRWRRARCLLLLGDMNVRQQDQESGRRFYEIGLRLAEEIGAAAEIEMFRGRLGSLNE